MSSSKDTTDPMPPASEPTFGRYLQAARLERNIRLDHVAEETRILLGTLEAIESEDVDRLPPDVFLKGFLRAFARAVGADEREAVARYLEGRRLRDAGSAAASPPVAARHGDGRKLALLCVILAALVALSFLTYQHWPERRTAELPAPTPSAEPAVSAAAPDQSPSEAVKRPQMPAVPMHVLVISAQDEGWVKVSIDQGTPSEYHLKAGGRLRLEASTGFNLLVGNAAGLKMTLDDRPVQVPGKRGEVVNLQLP